ncbi:hypothetical protein Tco_0568428 [Tanacetum coccineum]
MDREVKHLKQSRIPIVKVHWNSQRGPEFRGFLLSYFYKVVIDLSLPSLYVISRLALLFTTMPPKRRSQNNPTQTSPEVPLTLKAVNQLVREGVEEAIRAEQERMESTFGISEYVKGKKVKFSAATLNGQALIWWKTQVATLGIEVANGMPWAEMKKLMIDKL